MTDERWLDLLEKLQSEGKIQDRGTEQIEGRPGTVDWVDVDSALGTLRISRSSEPKKLGERAIYSKRGSSTATVTSQYDEHDIIHVFRVERYDEKTDEWVEIDIKHFSL